MSNFGAMTTRAGNRDHICEWCGQVIPKGEIFHHYKGMFEDQWQNWRMHEECAEQNSIDDPYGDGFTPFGNDRPEKLQSAS